MNRRLEGTSALTNQGKENIESATDRPCACGCGRLIATFSGRRYHPFCKGRLESERRAAKNAAANAARARVVDLSPAEIEQRFQIAKAQIAYQRKRQAA